MRYFLLSIGLMIGYSISSQNHQMSTIQEQQNFYKNYHFISDSQWDSLNISINGQSPVLASKTQTSSCSLTKKVFGWHPYWNGSTYNNYDWSMLSDFCYFDYTVDPSTGNNSNASFAWSTSAAVTAAKSNSVNIHFCATLFSNHSTFWASSTAQNTFISNAISLLNSRGGNGINIDFETMGSTDKTSFTNFMINLCTQMHNANPNYKVTMALYAVDWGPAFDVATLNNYVDGFIIMGYDYYYSGSAQAGPEAPLYNFQTSYNYTLSKSITYYLKAGASPSKLMLGLPYYGREWETVSNTAPSNTTGNFTASRLYNYVRNNSATYSSTNKNWDSNSFNPFFAYQSSGNWRQCWIDDIYSMGRKFDMVNQRGLAGIGIWALGYDDGYTDYWDLIKSKFSTCSTIACTDSIFDMGGPNRNYYDNENYTYSIAPTGASKLSLAFSPVVTEANFDTLFVFDGPSTSSPTLGVYTGTFSSSFTLTSTSPTVTIRFKSDGATNRSGFKAIWNCIVNTDNIAPTTQISIPVGWKTQNFTSTFIDLDNAGGSGIEKSFYQVSDFNGSEWRANGSRGFFNDDFNSGSINNEWTNSIGTWTLNNNALLQSDETNSNTNLYAAITQTLSNRYLYCFKGTINGAAPSRRAGIHIFCDDATQSNRGNNYLIWMRPDQGTIELYKNTSNTLNVVKTVTFTVSAGITYDYKISFDRITGELKLWINHAFVTSWIDPSPLINGQYISFRTGNCQFKIDDFKVFRSRAANANILLGTGNNNDIRFENTSLLLPGGNINSITKDNNDNLSSIVSQTINVDWTKPITSSIIKDGMSNDIDTTFIGTQLDLNYTAAKDTNSGIADYYYAIGSSPGAKDITPWTSNGLLLSASKTGLNLISGQHYYAMTKSMNSAGLMSDSIVSDGVIFLLSTFINSVAEENSVSIYPNPAKEQVMLSVISDQEREFQYSLTDINGKMILTEPKKKLAIGINQIQIPLQDLHLSTGIYFIRLYSDNKLVTKKIIIE